MGCESEKIFAAVHFFLACGDNSCILRMRSRFTVARERDSLRRTRVKIEFYIASRPATFPRHPNTQKKSRQTHALAACGRHLFHGVWRHVRDGGGHSWRGIRPRGLNPVVSAGAVV